MRGGGTQRGTRGVQLEGPRPVVGDEIASASLRTTLPVAQRSFSHEISKRIDSNRTNSSMET